jgi:uncharacterized membrane protein
MRHPLFFRWRGASRAFFSFPHIVLYSPAGYLPQAFAILFGKLLWIGPLGLMYLARLWEYAACVGIGYAALRCAPVFRWSLMLILLGPMSLYLMGSVAQDGILITGAGLLIALLIRMAVDPGHRVGGGEKAVLLALAALLPMAKFVYLPLAAVTPFLVLPRLPALRAKMAFGAAYVVFCLLPVAAWSRVIASLYSFGRTDIPIDPVAQLHHVASDPLAFLLLVGQSVAAQASDIYHKFVGVLGWVDTTLPTWFYGAYGYGLLGCLILESGEAGRVSWRQRCLLVSAVVLTVILTYLAIYAHWNSPGSRSPIDGIHGRYFLPLAPFLVMSFPPLARFRAPAWAAAALGTAMGATSAAVCLYAVVARYYLP